MLRIDVNALDDVLSNVFGDSGMVLAQPLKC